MSAIQPLLEQDGSLSGSTWPADTRAPTCKFRLPSIWNGLQRELLCMGSGTHALNAPSVSMELLKLTALLAQGGREPVSEAGGRAEENI